MKKTIIIFIVLLIIIAAGITIGTELFSEKPKAIVQDKSFNLLIAKTDKEKQIGLSDTDSLSSDSAMLFTFEKADYYSFWMKNMKFPIDIIFIKDNKIVTIYNNVEPATNNKELAVYQPQEPADSVLEINAGLAEKYGFKKDMEIKYENLGNWN